MLKNFARGGLMMAAVLAPSVALAHPGHAPGSDLLAGAAHPFGGLDHLLAMIAVGLFAFELGGRALWMVPSAFLAFMTVGGILGLTGGVLPFAEVGIALSVVVLGVLVAFRVKWGVASACAVSAGFAVFHGFAHAMEMPSSAAGIAYAVGFISATALLHAVGLGAGLLANHASARGPWIARGAGALASCAGVMMLTGRI